MIYYILENLSINYPNIFKDLFELFKYYPIRAAFAAISSLFICFLIGPKIIRTLIVHHYGETIRKTGPESHNAKKGTPTMGGIIIILSIILPTVLFAQLNNYFIIICLVSICWMGLIGFIDDYLKIKKKFTKGLIARYKIMGQLLLGLFVVVMLFENSENIHYTILNGEIFSGLNGEVQPIHSISIPFLKNYTYELFESELLAKISYALLIIFVIMGTSNAVNLSDGLDGLATGLTVIATLTFAVFCWLSGTAWISNYLNILYIEQSKELFIFCLAVAGSCIGFLWYNAKPAKIFMGDVGSLTLGAILGCLAILLKREILLILIGGVFVIESLSVIIQVLYFRYTKRKYGKGIRLFLMAPIHHHFELKGLEENHVVIRFWIIGVIFALIALSTIKIQ